MPFPADIHGIVIYPASWAKTHKERWDHTTDINRRDEPGRIEKRQPQQLEMPREFTGSIISSPNDRPYPLRHNRAASRLFSPRQREFMLVGDSAARKHIGLSPEEQHEHFTHLHGIGSWENSVEPAMATIFHKPISSTQLHKVGAEVGTWARQHGILTFSPHPEGTEQLMHMRVPTHNPSEQLDPHTVARISKMVTGKFNKYFDPGEKPDFWMPGRTILPDTTGHSDVLVWVPPWEKNPSRLHEAFADIAHSMEADRPRYWPGHGTLLGGTSPYSDDEAKHFDDAKRREVAIANYKKVLESQGHAGINPQQTGAQRLADILHIKLDKTEGIQGPGSMRSDIGEGYPFADPSKTNIGRDPERPSAMIQPGESEHFVIGRHGRENVSFNQLAKRYVDPDELFGKYYGRPEETFASPHTDDVFRDEGHRTHYQILDDLFDASMEDYPEDITDTGTQIESGGDPSLPRDRFQALNRGWVMGRTGDVLGRRVMSFWNDAYQEDLVKAHVAAELVRGNLDPTDYVSFVGARRLMPAHEFIGLQTTPEERAVRHFTPEELAAGHVNPAMRAAIRGGEKPPMPKKPWVEAAVKSGIMPIGGKLWAAMSESRHGDPIRLASGEIRSDIGSAYPFVNPARVNTGIDPNRPPRQAAVAGREPSPKFKELKEHYGQYGIHYDPDHIFIEDRGVKALETFVAEDPFQVHRGDGASVTHYDILDNLFKQGNTRKKLNRDSAVDKGWVLGRTGDVHGTHVMSFWNHPEQDKAVQDFVRTEIERGLLHPKEDYVSVMGHGMLPAGEFMNKDLTTTPTVARPLTEEEKARMGAAHVNPAERAAKRAKEGKPPMPVSPWREALKRSGLLAPGQKLWGPMSESRYGEPIRLGSEREPAKPANPPRMRAPSKVGIVVRGVYYPPGKYAPGIIQAGKKGNRLLDFIKNKKG